MRSTQAFAIPTVLELLKYRLVVANQIVPFGAATAAAQLVEVVAILIAAVVAEAIALATALVVAAALAEFELAIDQHMEDKSLAFATVAFPLSDLAHQSWWQLLSPLLLSQPWQLVPQPR